MILEMIIFNESVLCYLAASFSSMNVSMLISNNVLFFVYLGGGESPFTFDQYKR